MNVALVEDQPDIAHLMEVQLSFLDVKVVAVLPTYDAVVNYDSWDEVDAATVDYMLPGSDRHDGVAVSRWLASHHPHVTTVVVTAAPNAFALAHPDYAGVVLDKPYDIDDLILALQGGVPGGDT